MVVAVLALGVGLGMSTTMFAVLDAVLHPLVAYRDPDGLFYINTWFGRRSPMSPADVYRFLRDEAHSFEAIVPVRDEIMGSEIYEGGDAWVRRAPARFFAVAGLRPRLGRLFTDSDGDGVAVLSNDLWQRGFGSRRSLEGATVKLGDRTYAVIGVLPRGIFGSAIIPLASSAEQTGTRGFGRPLVRLRAGVTPEQAGAELKTLARLLTGRFGDREAPFAFDLSPIVSRREELKDIHKAMVGSALVVLLIACVNLAHLMLARGLAKRRELALRMALGASRAAVVRQMFSECLVMTVAGAGLGALLAVWGSDVLQHHMPPQVAWLGVLRPQLSWRVFAAATFTAALSAVLFGLVPAIRVALDVNVSEPLKDDSGTTTGRVRQRYSPLVVTEVALALVLLMGGGLLLHTVYRLQREHFGFDSRSLFRAYLFNRRGSDSTARASRGEILAAARAAEGVQGVAVVTHRSLLRVGNAVSPELATDTARVISMRSYQVVSPEYLHVLGLPILRGRDFEPGDAAGSGVAIIDPIAAQRLYPSQNPVGHMLKLGGPAAAAAQWVPIVGVVRSPSILEAAGRYAPEPAVFVARADSATGYLLIRTSTPDSRITARLESRLRKLPGQAMANVFPYDYARQAELASRGFLAKVFVGMGSVALGLAALGLYAVLAYAVSRRMREFAVRLALGAEPAALRRMVLHDGLVMLLAGIGVGAFVALATARLLDAVLIEVLPSDVASLALSEAVLLAVGLAAALGPARRAARANPVDILRAI